jgi:hypothetical protein
MSEKIYSGGCLCGAVRFEAKAPAARPHTCSCKMCQRHTGGLTLAWVEFPRDAVKWTGKGGKPATYRSSPISSRAFCKICGSSLGAIDDAPTVIETHVIESGERMGGVGEPPVPPATPALVNAVSALLGRRIRKLPLADQLA